MLARLRLSWLTFWGRVANLAGFPGFVREADYVAESGATVSVRKSALYTVVTVNGVEAYFYRLTGGLDGVSQTSRYRPADTPRLADSAAPFAEGRQPPTQK